jgi:hypothetical protein
MSLEGTPCADCGETYSIWYADNDLWNAVMRLPDGSDRAAHVCPRCFLIRAEPITEFARITWPETPSRRDVERASAFNSPANDSASSHRDRADEPAAEPSQSDHYESDGTS